MNTTPHSTGITRSSCKLLLPRYIWNKESIPGITKRLTKSATGFSQFEVEEYKEKSDEEMEVEVLVKDDFGSSSLEDPKMTSPGEGHSQEAAKPLELMDEKTDEMNDSEDEKGLECSLQREVSAEEVIIHQLESRSRKASGVQE